MLRPEAAAAAPGVRTGERVYCLSNPGGYYFMFTQGMVARLNRKRNEVLDEHGHTNGLLTRPILFLNVTAEFAPGSSGAAIADEAGNVVAQVASIADAGEPPAGNTNAPPSPSVPVRFCTAAEEILRLTKSSSRLAHPAQGSNAPPVRPKRARRTEGLKVAVRPEASPARPRNKPLVGQSCLT